MQDVTLIGIDLGKHSFHVHGQDRHGKALLRKKFSRKQLIEFLAKFHACTVVMEACEEQTAQSFLLERRRTLRNCGLLYVENMSIVGFDGSAVAPSDISTSPCDRDGFDTISLIASSACKTPMTPTTGPRMPPSPQLSTLSAGGGLGNTHR